MPRDPARRIEAIQWLMFQMAGVGPMFGQLGWFKRNGADNQQAITRYTDETARLAGVLDQRLGETEYLEGELRHRRLPGIGDGGGTSTGAASPT